MTRVWKRSKENFAQAAQRLSGVPAGIRKSFPCRKRNYLKRHKKADLTLIEADGARHLPCKAPAEHEPVLLSSSDLVIGVTGLSALGQPLGKGCFRAERAAELLGCTMEHHITEEDLARLIASEQGQQKDLKGRTFYAVLHQYEEKEHRAAAEKLVELLRRQGIEHVLVTCATGNRRQSGENTNPWYGRAELPVREAEEEWEPGE